MKRLMLILLCLGSWIINGMDDDFSHNTYRGTLITPETLITLAPPIPPTFDAGIDEWMGHNAALVSELVTTPHPLTHENRREKTARNLALIKQFETEGKGRNLSDFNYVLKPDGRNFTVPINRWGSRVAYWVYASNQGSVLDPTFNGDFDCSQCEHLPSYQHCSRVAHYLRLREIIEKKRFQHLKTAATYLKHIPHKPATLSDEHYVVVQEWVPNLTELKQMPEREQLATRKNIAPAALEEIYHAIVYAALWDIRGNLAVNSVDGSYCMLDLEEPFNHKPQFFFFQGEEGEKKYVQDVVDGLERMAQKLQAEPSQIERWKRFASEDRNLQTLLQKHGVLLNFNAEHLDKKD